MEAEEHVETVVDPREFTREDMERARLALLNEKKVALESQETQLAKHYTNLMDNEAERCGFSFARTPL